MTVAAGFSRVGPASFWHGGPLSWLEQLCLRSYPKHGMPLVLFSYAPIADLPEGIENRDAAEILPQTAIFFNQERQSFAPFSDYFRYLMLQKTPYYWVDTDAYAHAPYRFTSDHIYAWHGRIVATGILSLPQDDLTLARLVRVCEGKLDSLPWLTPEQHSVLKTAPRQQNGRIDPGALPYKALGPMALTWLLQASGDIKHAQPRDIFYPVDPRHILRPVKWRLRRLPPHCVSIHLFASVVRRRMRDANIQMPPEGSLLDALLSQDGISTAEFPSPT